MDGAQELLGISSGKIRSADGTGEESVSGDQEGMVGKVEADAALGVAGGVEHGSRDARDRQDLAVAKRSIRWGDLGGGHLEPGGLDIHHLDQGQIVLVVVDGSPGELLETLSSGDMVDMSMGDDDGLHSKAVALDDGLDGRNVVPGIDDDGFTGSLISQDGAIALKQADGKDLVDHLSRLMAKGGFSGSGSTKVARQNLLPGKPIGRLVDHFDLSLIACCGRVLFELTLISGNSGLCPR